jgi:ribosomal protein S18 acetylase RimI-like enzyme
VPSPTRRSPIRTFSSSPRSRPAWVRETAASYGGSKANDALLNGIVSRIRQPAAFAALDLDGEHVAWGLGVAERGWIGLYDIVVAPDLRGIGLGRRVVMSLMAWGRGEGATRAYLQVREDNVVARSLYEGLGFDLAYRYTHRIMP